MSDIIDLLKAKEEEAEAMIERARSKAEEILKEAAIEASRIKIKLAEETKKKLQALRITDATALKDKIAEIEQEGQMQIKRVKNDSKEHMDGAVKEVFETITKGVKAP